MFDVGFAELFLLSLIGLLVLGPERLPAVARTLGGFVRKARISYHNLKRTVEAELAAADAANPIKEAKQELDAVQREVKALGEKLNEDQMGSLTPTAADPEPETEAESGAEARAEAEAEAEAEAVFEPASASNAEPVSQPEPTIHSEANAGSEPKANDGNEPEAHDGAEPKPNDGNEPKANDGAELKTP